MPKFHPLFPSSPSFRHRNSAVACHSTHSTHSPLRNAAEGFDTAHFFSFLKISCQNFIPSSPLPLLLGTEILQSLVIQPIQRIPRYEMLLKDLIRHTSSLSPKFHAKI